MKDSVAPAKSPRRRSPSYPGSTLEVAIQRARILYQAADRHPMPIADILKKWNFSNPNSGNAQVGYSAVKKYGLITETGKGKDRVARISDLAVDVLNPNPNQAASIEKAALLPTMMRDWWEKYKLSLPPLETLNYDYIAKGQFTQAGLNEFVRIYRANIAFAKLDPSATVDDIGEDAGDPDSFTHLNEDDSSEPIRRRKPVRKGMMSYTIPVARGEDVVIDGAFPLSEAKWERLQTILNAMKPAIVGEDETDPTE